MSAPVRILHLDDDPLDAQLVAMTLEFEQKKFPSTLRYVQTKEEYLAALACKDFDVILSDYRMPGYDGDAALASAQAICPEIPFIMVTGELGEEFAIERLQRGATDYVLKDRIFRLIPAIKRALAEAENQKKRRAAERESQRRQAELWAIIQAMNGGVMVFDPEGNTALVNEAQVQMLGYNEASELKHNVTYLADLFEFFDERGQAVPLEDWPVTRIMHGETVANLELKGRRKDTGREWFLSFSGQPVRDENGEQILSVIVTRDITEKRRSEEALRRSEERFSAAFKRSPYPQLISRLEDGVFLDVNDALLSFYGMTREEIIGHSSFELGIIAQPEEREEMVRRISRDGALENFPMHINTRILGRRLVLVSASLLKSTAEKAVLMVVRDITQEQQDREEVERSHQLLSEVLESIHDAFYAMDANMRITYVNHHAEAILHHRREDLVGKNIWEVFPNALGSESYKNILRAYRERVAIHYETHSPVLKTWIESSVYPTSGGGISVFFREITERKLIELALKESEERFHTLADNIPQLAWMADEKGWVFWYNQRWYDYTGTTPEDMEGWGWQKVHQPEHVAHVVEKFKDAVEHGTFWEDTFPLRSRTGQYRWFLSRAVPIKDEEGNVLRWFGTNTDITEQRQAEEALRESRAKLEAALSSMTDAVFISDAQGRFIEINDAFATFHRFKSKDECLMTLKEYPEILEVFMANGERAPLDMWAVPRALRGEVVTNAEYSLRRIDTGETWVGSYSFGPIRGKDGEIVGSVVVGRDITEVKKAESEIRRLNEELEERVKRRTAALERANKELEGFSYSVSHDLRSPLRLVNAFADLLVRQGLESLTPKQKESLRTIQTQVTRMDELIKALLEFSRLTREELRLVSVDTRKMAEEVVKEQRQVLGEEAARRVLVEIGDLPLVEADPVLLRMVFTNLLSNAFKFTRAAKDPTVRIDAKLTDGFYTFRIQDNGVGFPKEQTERLFKVFQRLHGAREFEGTGIGLANVMKIIERHGGQVCGEGEEGVGATFFFTLPVRIHEANAIPLSRRAG